MPEKNRPARALRATVMCVFSVVMAAPVVGLAAQDAPPAETDATFADPVLTSEIRITWSQIVKVVDAHPQITAGQHEIAAARAAVDAAGVVPNPSLELSGAYGQANDNSISRMEWGLGLSIPLGWIAMRGAQIDAAGAEAKVADARARGLRRDILLQLRLQFWNLVYAQARVEALEELHEQTRALVTTVKRRVDQGEVRPVEATRVEVEAEKMTGELETARSTLTARRAQLAMWLRDRAPGRLVAVGDLTALPVAMTAQRARARARAEHPVVLAAVARVEASAAKVSVEQRARMPAVEVGAFTDHELDRRAYGLGVSVELPVWNWNQAHIQQAEATLAADRQRLEAKRIELEAAAIEAQSACQAGVTRATRYQDRALPKAVSATRTIERTYQLGEATLLEVIDARRTLLETRRQSLEAWVRAQVDCSRLSALTGEDLS